MSKTSMFIRLLLFVIAAASVISLIFMQLDISDKEKEIALVTERIKEQKIRNSELADHVL